MQDERLPSVNYRISADYGTVMLAKSVNSPSDDIFGPTVNLCSKINRKAHPNGMVIGNDLFQVVKSLQLCDFESTSGYSSGLLNEYPVYSIKPKISEPILTV